MKIKKVLIVLVTILMLILPGCGSKGSDSAAAQKKFPKKSIDFTLLFAAGTSSDLAARQLADIAQKDLGQPIVCNNRNGGGGAVGYQYVLTQPADGYNIVWNSNSISTCYYQGNLSANQNYKAFRGVCNLTSEPYAIAVKADAPWKTLQEFLDYAKANPGKASLVNGGVGSFSHLTAVAFEQAAGIKVNHLFNNSNPVTVVLGGQADALMNTASNVTTYAQSGQLRILGVVANKRVETLKDVPTVKEQGVDLDLMMYRGIAVAKDTPDDVVKILEEAFIKAAQNATFQEFVNKSGSVIDIKGAAEFDQYMAQEDAKMAELMQKIGMKKQ
jgi:tripartite-type tricarboxylate transporter receptor subunit TctC